MPRIPTGRARVAVIAAASVAAIGGGAAVTLGVASGTGTSAPSAQTPAERPGPRGGGAALDAVATYLGLSADALRDELRSGTTLAALAAERGKTVDGLVDAIVAAETRRLQEAVAAGRLTDAERDRIVAGLPQRVRRMVTSTRPGPGGPGGRDCPPGERPGAAASAAGLRYGTGAATS
jgi:hypothetical protein